VDVERDGRYLKGGVLGLAGPLQLRVQVRVVGVGLFRPRVRVRLRRHQAHGRVVHPLLVGVLVGLDGAFAARSEGLPACILVSASRFSAQEYPEGRSRNYNFHGQTALSDLQRC